MGYTCKAPAVNIGYTSKAPAVNIVFIGKTQKVGKFRGDIGAIK